ncbi:MAG: aspartate--tRNA ligase [Waddliaceae bacterium]
MFDYRRTHHCGFLRKEHIATAVTLSGWVHRRRDHGGLIFIDLRDLYGLTQLVFDPEKDPDLHAAAEKLRSEWVIAIKGLVIPRREGMANRNLPTGEIEVGVQEMEVLSKARTPPFSICDETIEANEEIRLKYRYLDIRRKKVANNLVQRHHAMLATRNFLNEKGFFEIATPILAKSTPEGARDYLVPSRIHPASFYALPQSPQLFKQLLMIAGMDRYFQIAPCFRDEDLRADRQPEFTQIDIEMSFDTPETLLAIIEELLHTILSTCCDRDIPTPFRRLSYRTCMERFGTDRPDTRFGMELVTLSDLAQRSGFSVFLDQLKAGGIVKGLCVKGGADLSRREIDNYTQFVGQLGIKGLAWMKKQSEGLASSIVKFFPTDVQQEMVVRMDMQVGDLIFMISDFPENANQGLDHLRRKIAQDRKLIPPSHFDLLWVTDFPLFSWDAERQRYDSLHHPFTSPHVEDLHLLDTDPLNVRSYGYDLILNGYEIGGGSQRIHDEQLQKKIFDLLKMPAKEQQEKFGFFLEALGYGTPPHLGIALGLDRLMMILTETDNIRDVIAFPKTQKASDLMMQCPAPVHKEQLLELGLSTEEKK